MRVDLLYALTNRTGEMPWHEILQYTRKHAVMAEQLGFDTVWMGEHHFDVDGTDAVPNPILLASDIAARTSTLRLGMAAVVATLWHPIRMAEDLAMLDQMSDGRLDIAFARGIQQHEVMNLNPEADRWRSAEVSNAIFEENIEIARKAWTEDPFSWSSERYTFPYPGLKYRPAQGAPAREGYGDDQGNLIGLGLYPRPFQDPYPSLRYVTESMNGFRNAARNDCGTITWFPTGQVLQGLFDGYKDEVQAVTGTRPTRNDRCGVLRMATIAETDEEARRVSEKAVTDFFEFICGIRGIGIWLDADEGGHLHLGAAEQGRVERSEERFADIVPYDFLLERDQIFNGSPDTVAEQMVRMTREHGIEHWLLQFGYPGISNPDVERSMELFSKHVLPEVQKALD